MAGNGLISLRMRTPSTLTPLKQRMTKITCETGCLGAMDGLSEREKFIVKERQIIDEPRTLESLGQELGLSKERVRQIEAAAFTKMRRFLEKNAREVQNFL